MDIEFLADKKISLFMKDYTDESIDLFGEELSVTVSSPENKGLQNIYESSTRTENKYAYNLQSIVAKLPLVGKRGRPYLEPAKLLLCTRVRKSTNEENSRLREVLQYI